MVDEYQEARNISKLLLDANLETQALLMIEPLKYGNNGTEIFMWLRYNSYKILENLDVPTNIREKTKLLIRSLDDKLSI